MSVMNLQKTLRDIKPPDKGSFPLDHEGLCKEIMVKYMRCLRGNNNNGSICRQHSKDYLECRMNNDLMKKEDFAKLGFKEMASDSSVGQQK